MSFITVSPLTLILGGVLVAFACILMFVHIRSRMKREHKTLPGPMGYPILGAAHIIGRFKNHWAAFSALRKQYGDIYGVTIGSRQCVVISKPSYIKEVLKEKANDFANRPDFLRFHAIFRGNRNLSIALCDWSGKQKIRRDHAYPFMHPKTGLSLVPLNHYIVSELQELVSTLSGVQNQPVEPRKLLNICTGNIFYQFICSKRFSEDDPTFLKIVDIYDAVFRQLFSGHEMDFMPWLKVFSFRELRSLRKRAGQVSEVTEAIVREHVTNPELRDLIDVFQTQMASNPENCPITNEDMEVIIEDLIGGHSVLGNMWLWGLYFLAANPEVCKNIREEVSRATCGMRSPQIDDKLPYTEATSCEILRIVSSPIIPHVSTKETSINGYHIDKDTMVMFNINDINMNSEYWPEPLKFNPTRFLTSEGNVMQPDYFFPFGTGKRSCLGDRLVKSTLRLGLATLLQNFEISLPQGYPEPDFLDIPGLVVPRQEISLIFRRLDTAININ